MNIYQRVASLSFKLQFNMNHDLEKFRTQSFNLSVTKNDDLLVLKKYRINCEFENSTNISMGSKKFEFWNLNLAIKIYIKNEPGIENMRSRNFQKMFKILN